MANKLLLVNPRRRRKARRRPSTRRKTRSRKRRRNPAPPGSRRRTRRATTRRRRRRRNPSLRSTFSSRNIMDVGKAAATGAAGAILLDVGLGFLPIPANWKAGIGGDVVKGLAAVALGALANMSKFVRPSTARDMTVGALTVQFTGIGRKLLTQVAPGVALSAYMNEDYEAALGYAGSGWNPDYSLDWNNGNVAAYNAGEGQPIAAPGFGQPGLDAYTESADFGY